MLSWKKETFENYGGIEQSRKNMLSGKFGGIEKFRISMLSGKNRTFEKFWATDESWEHMLSGKVGGIQTFGIFMLLEKNGTFENFGGMEETRKKHVIWEGWEYPDIRNLHVVREKWNVRNFGVPRNPGKNMIFEERKTLDKFRGCSEIQQKIMISRKSGASEKFARTFVVMQMRTFGVMRTLKIVLMPTLKVI